MRSSPNSSATALQIQDAKTSFAPRAGFAWRPFGDDKTVILGGVGRYIETLLSALITAGWAVEASEVGSYTNSVVNGKAALSFPYAFPANLSQPGVATFEYASALHYKDPYVTQWNLTIERSLGFGTALRVTRPATGSGPNGRCADGFCRERSHCAIDGESIPG